MGTTLLEAISGALTLLLILGITVAVPFLLIWCLNTLGVASASYGVMEWLAGFVLTTLFLSG